MRELSLFTGAGGGLLGGLILGWHLTAAVEWDAYCQRVLCARGGYMADTEGGRGDGPVLAGEREAVSGTVPASEERRGFPVHGDIRTFHPVPGSCDIVTGGFPCQPFSQAGKRLGEDDPRNMWPHAVRVLVESGAPLGFFENVPGLLSSGYFGTVLGDLAEAGFDAEWCVLGADDVGAPHRRKRLWILAYRQEYRSALRNPRPERSRWGGTDGDGSSPWAFDPADVAHSDGSGREERRRAESVGAEHGATECGGEDAREAVADTESGESRQPSERQGRGDFGGAGEAVVCDPPSGGQSVCGASPQPRHIGHAVRADGDGQRVKAWVTLTGLGGTSHGLAASLDRVSGT